MNRSADRKRQHPLPESIILFIAKLLIRAGLVLGAWQFRRGAGRLRSRNLAGLCLNAYNFLAYALGPAVRALQSCLCRFGDSENGRLQSPISTPQNSAGRFRSTHR